MMDGTKACKTGSASKPPGLARLDRAGMGAGLGMGLCPYGYPGEGATGARLGSDVDNSPLITLPQMSTESPPRLPIWQVASFSSFLIEPEELSIWQMASFRRSLIVPCHLSHHRVWLRFIRFRSDFLAVSTMDDGIVAEVCDSVRPPSWRLGWFLEFSQDSRSTPTTSSFCTISNHAGPARLAPVPCSCHICPTSSLTGFRALHAGGDRAGIRMRIPGPWALGPRSTRPSGPGPLHFFFCRMPRRR